MSNILNSFLKAPVLKINSAQYPFSNFDFLEEKISDGEFRFPTNLVLGMQAEACFETILRMSKKHELLLANLQINASNTINNQKETLGELDYIVKNLITKEVSHIELACKFYLYDENNGTAEEKKWIGPNRKDTLYDKLEKVKLKQFPLLHSPETIKKLRDRNIEFPTSQKLCIKAFLFLPKEISSDSFPGNYSNCLVGHWIKHGDFNKEDKTAKYAIPIKKEWLLPIEIIEEWYCHSEIEKLINEQIQNKKSPLIYKKTPHTTERFFVVWW
ncbi:DUF1853 family protein [Aequorivita sediminis]|uniref:DUF1853 family protein n=1 Tax=Aequorivita sediminis TaxID=3073653 RepID=UPI0028A5AE18|nr:DUF1853 family protein [Aequorivita sp. F6058]